MASRSQLLYLVALITCAVLYSTSPAHARPAKGFHEGPYLQLNLGARSAKFDTDQVTSIKQGQEIEPAYGFTFGWNITDPFAFELRGLYSTSGAGISQQHLINMNIDVKWNFIIDPLVDFKSLRLIPFVNAGNVLEINILPGTTGSNSARVVQLGTGLDMGGGISALFFHDSVYLTLRGGPAYVYREKMKQTVNSVSRTVYSGGWSWDWTALAGLGAHF